MKTKHLLLSVFILAASLAGAWNVALPPETIIPFSPSFVTVEEVRLPVETGTSNTLVRLSIHKAVAVNTNGVAADVLVSAKLDVTVQRNEIMAILGQQPSTNSVALAVQVDALSYGTLTNAVQGVAFGKLSQALPAIAGALSE